jgi:hypothetical protein
MSGSISDRCIRDVRIDFNRFAVGPLIVVPAKAGTHLGHNSIVDKWVPAFVGTTTFKRPPHAVA